MQPMIGKWLIAFGIAIVILGVLLASGKGIPFLGRLPGDIRVERPGGTFYFPIVTCLLLSALLSLFFTLFRK